MSKLTTTEPDLSEMWCLQVKKTKQNEVDNGNHIICDSTIPHCVVPPGDTKGIVSGDTKYPILCMMLWRSAQKRTL